MKKSFKKLNLTIELDDDTILIRETSTLMLLKAKSFRVDEVLGKYNSLIETYQQRELSL
jgi:hypothetical protein